MPDKPRYQHDCDQCEFLGHWFGCDVYFYKDEEPCPALVSRTGDGPSDYYYRNLRPLHPAWVADVMATSYSKSDKSPVAAWSAALMNLGVRHLEAIVKSEVKA